MLSLTELALISLASYRATQAVTDDSILDGARARLEVWHADKAESKIRTFIVDLVGCIFCVGFWLSGITLFTYLAATGKWHDEPIIINLMQWWAVAGAQALLNYRANTWAHS